MESHTVALFLATVATATAAFVAIVGGLLVSRVVALATESSGLTHRRDDLAGQLVTERARRTEFERRVLAADADYVLRPKYDELAKAKPSVDLALWIAEEEVKRTIEEIQPFLDEVLAQAAKARERLSVVFEAGVPDFEFHELFGATATHVPSGQRDIYEAVFNQLVEEHTPAPTGPFVHLEVAARGFHVPEILFTVQDTETYLQLVRDLDEVEHRVAALEVQLEQTGTALARVVRPVGVRRGLAVLAYFAIVGAVAPLYLLLFVDQLREWTPFAVLGGFVSGLLALLGYVFWQIAHITVSRAT